MTTYIDEAYWRDALSKPDWYLLLRDDFGRVEKLAAQENDYAKRKQIKAKAYALVEEAIRSGRLPVATRGNDFDADRKTIDTVVIHHTGNKPGMTLDRLNAMQLLRIYGGYYANPTNPGDQGIKGQPIWSGHFYRSRQVFWAYHWLVRTDGSKEQLLDDKYVGWHAGNWDTNTRSIAICIDDDLSHKEPDESVIRAVSETIKLHYPDIHHTKILGHQEVNDGTQCPGHLFAERWKQKLIANLYSTDLVGHVTESL